MRMNLRRFANVTLLVVLLLTPFAMIYASSTNPKPASIPPALLVSNAILGISLSTRTSDTFDPTPMILMVPATTSTPETLALAPAVAGMAVNSDVHSQIIESAEAALPDEDRTLTRLAVPNNPNQTIDSAEAILPDEDRTPTRLVVPNIQNWIIKYGKAFLPEEDRTPIRLAIPVIRLDAPVEAMGWYTETRNRQTVNIWNVPDHFAAGWLKTSALVGVPGNTVLDGHHNVLGRVFENLVDLEVGDFITLYTASREHSYLVAEKLILKDAGQPMEVRLANAQYISPTTDERLTLVTCWPPTGNSYRLIIIARPVSELPTGIQFLGNR